MTQSREQVLELYRHLLHDTVQDLYEGIYTGELAADLERKMRELPDPERAPSADTLRTALVHKMKRLRTLVGKRSTELVQCQARVLELEDILDQQEQQYYRAAEERDTLKKQLANADTVRMVRAAFADSVDRSAVRQLIELVQEFLGALQDRDAQKMYQIGLKLQNWLENNKATIDRILEKVPLVH